MLVVLCALVVEVDGAEQIKFAHNVIFLHILEHQTFATGKLFFMCCLRRNFALRMLVGDFL